MTRTNLAIILFVAVVFSLPSQAYAQGVPSAFGPTTVAVTPDGGTTAQWEQNTSGHSQTFFVKNIGTSQATYTLTCFGRTNVTCTQVVPSQVTLNANQQVDVEATYNVGLTGTGRLVVRAENGATMDTGYVAVPVIHHGAPPIALRNHNGDNRDRSLCLTVGGGEAAAVQCGDLLITHSLPGYATLGRDRALTLLYSSHQAAPKPLIALTVTQGGTLETPTSVFARLTVGVVPKDSATWNGWGSHIVMARQIGLGNGYDASPDSTGIYPFTMLVRNTYTGIGVYDTTVSDTLIVVNRRNSRFGAGWSMAGLEELRLNQPGNKILWVGGDGSAKVYRNINATTWLASPGAFRDTLVKFDTLNTSWYRRTLRHGVQVTFDSAGRHIRTTNRARQYTQFYWRKPAPTGISILDSIAVPPHNADGSNISGTVYRFTYTSGDTTLDRITDPSGRIMDVSVVSRRLTQIVDPDNAAYHTDFTYDATARMLSRTNRRSFATSYKYGSGPRVDTVKVPLDVAVGDTAATLLAAWDEKGLAVGLSGQVAIDTASAFSQFDGPRTDVADMAQFWVDRWGAPLRIVGAVADTTLITRADAIHPALITQVISADHRVIKTAWSARGNLLESRDSTSHLGSAGLPTSVSRWTYPASGPVDSPDTLIDPAGLRTRFSYDSIGLPLTIKAPNGHVTLFETWPAGNAKGLVRAAVDSAVAVWDSSGRHEITAHLRAAAAFNGLGNVVSDTSPIGRVTRTTRDAVQRVDTMIDPMGHRTDMVYDALNRAVLSIRHVEGLDSGFSAPDTTRAHYNIDVLDSVIDPRKVARQFGYDAAARPKTERDDYLATETRFFNRVGLVDSVRPRAGSTTLQVRNVYDAGNRPTKTKWNPTSQAAADSVIYSYDVMGRMLTAGTVGRQITRVYYATGAIRQEVQSQPNGANAFRHTYGYDAAGRRIWYVIGIQGDARRSDSISYLYDAVSGDLRWIKVRWRLTSDNVQKRDSVQLWWDALGRRDSVVFSNAARVWYAYDKDGMMRVMCGIPQQGGVNPSVFSFTDYQKGVDAEGLVLRTRNAWLDDGVPMPGCGGLSSGIDTRNTYDSKHQLLLQVSNADSNIYRYDASGNRTVWRHLLTSGTVLRDERDFMDPFHNRLRKTMDVRYPNDSSRFSYDSNGSRALEQPYVGGSPQQTGGYRQYYYDGLGRSMGTSEFQCGGWNTAGECTTWGILSPTLCAYDPLGRMHDPCDNLAPIVGFDGSNVVRTGNDSVVNTSTWTFVQGPGVDDPLMGFYTTSTGVTAYWVTDGNGRQFAVGGKDGADCNSVATTCGAAYYQWGRYAGGVGNGRSFGSFRDSSTSIYKVGFFRNRWYDQQTGRWTQEDPIGVSDDPNLYQFNGNNPIAYTDPFGLCAAGDGTGNDGAAKGDSGSDNPTEDQGSQLECEANSGTVTTSNSSGSTTVQVSTQYSWDKSGTPEQIIDTRTGLTSATQFVTITATNLRTGKQRSYTASAGSDTGSSMSPMRNLGAGELSRERTKAQHVRDECKKRQKKPSRPRNPAGEKD